MIVHFTNALYPVALFFLILSYYYKPDFCRFAYYHLLILATVSVPLSYTTGFLEWKKKYKGYRTRIFMQKIRVGILLFGLGLLNTLWYGMSPAVVDTAGLMRAVFLLLNFVHLPLVFYLGYLGGRLVFGGAH